jgi:hypothetical protein
MDDIDFDDFRRRNENPALAAPSTRTSVDAVRDWLVPPAPSNCIEGDPALADIDRCAPVAATVASAAFFRERRLLNFITAFAAAVLTVLNRRPILGCGCSFGSSAAASKPEGGDVAFNPPASIISSAAAPRPEGPEGPEGDEGDEDEADDEDADEACIPVRSTISSPVGN